MSRIDAFLELAIRQGGSDLHLLSGQVPRIRVHGELQPVAFRELAPNDIDGFLAEIMPPGMSERVEAGQAADFAYVSDVAGRFRVSTFRHSTGIAVVLRSIPSVPPKLDSIGLPGVVQNVLSIGKGLVLVTGPTGCGKSSTLAAMVDWVNENRHGHIVTLEDPIEFLHEPRQCAITQREIGRHAPTFAAGLRNALREDPNAILVGDLRDHETANLALAAAETGVLVLGTLHTSGAMRTVDRIVNVFPSQRQDQVRSMLADCLRMVVSQRLVRKLDGSGRQVAAEVMVNTIAVSSMIRQGNTHKLHSVLQAGQRTGMQSLDSVLQDLVLREVISGEEALEHAIDRALFERHLSGDQAA
jgi:twitching motility protein PilT